MSVLRTWKFQLCADSLVGARSTLVASCACKEAAAARGARAQAILGMSRSMSEGELVFGCRLPRHRDRGRGDAARVFALLERLLYGGHSTRGFSVENLLVASHDANGFVEIDQFV